MGKKFHHHAYTMRDVGTNTLALQHYVLTSGVYLSRILRMRFLARNLRNLRNRFEFSTSIRYNILWNNLHIRHMQHHDHGRLHANCSDDGDLMGRMQVAVVLKSELPRRTNSKFVKFDRNRSFTGAPETRSRWSVNLKPHFATVPLAWAGWSYQQLDSHKDNHCALYCTCPMFTTAPQSQLQFNAHTRLAQLIFGWLHSIQEWNKISAQIMYNSLLNFITSSE